MAKLVISLDGVVTMEATLVQQRTTLGRRPYNDIVIENLAVSGEHAALHMLDQEVEIEDLRSTNGTYVNGIAVTRKVLRDGDTLHVGNCSMRFFSERPADFEETVFFQPSGSPSTVDAVTPIDAEATASDQESVAAGDLSAVPRSAAVPHGDAGTALIRIVSGTGAGREVVLNKVVTTLGQPGVAVASVMHRRQGFVLAHVEGAERPRLNGASIGDGAVPLAGGDVVWLAGVEMLFVQQ